MAALGACDVLGAPKATGRAGDDVVAWLVVGTQLGGPAPGPLFSGDACIPASSMGGRWEQTEEVWTAEVVTRRAGKLSLQVCLASPWTIQQDRERWARLPSI